MRKEHQVKFHLLIPAFILLLTSMSFAQSNSNDVDPFLGHYTLGGLGSVMSFYTSTGQGCQVMGSDSVLYGSGNTVTANRIAYLHVPFGPDTVISVDCISGNFLMGSLSDQQRDEVICGTIETVGDSLTYVSLYVQQLINGSWSAVWYPIDSLKKQSNASSNRNEIRMTSGYFDGGQAKEFAVAYNLPDSAQKITIRMFRLDSSTGSPIQITSIQGDTFPENLGAQAFFDISAGDYDGDGLDEIMLVNNADIARSSCMSPFYALLLHFHVYDFDVTNTELVSKVNSNYPWSMCIGDPKTNTLTQLTMTSGDFNGDGRVESACGWVLVSPYNGDLIYWLQMISVSPDLMTFTFENGFSGRGVVGRTPYGVWPTSTTLSLAAGDLDKDGKEELVYAAFDSVYIYKFSSTLFPTKTRQFSCNSRTDDPSHRTVAIEDIDGSTAFADSSSSNWYPEIISFGWTNNPTTQSTSGNDNTYIYRAYKLTDPANFTFITKVCNNLGCAFLSASTGHGEGGIIPAYFAGNKITMGKPKKVSVTHIIEPSIIINAPPIHFDVIGDSCFDICKSFPIGGSSAFSSELVQSATNEAEVTTEVHSTWGVSATLSAGGDFLGIGVKASLTAKYGQDFKNTNRADSTMTVKFSDQAIWDDRIYATVTDYDLWEYPVYADGVKEGNIMAAIAHPQAARWFQSNDGNYGNDIVMDHEPGNLLSYPDYGNPLSNPDVANLIYKGDSYSINPSSSPAYSELTWQTVTSNSGDTSSNYGLTLGASVEGWGVKLETEGDYSHGSINTQTTTVTHSIDMTAHFGAINPLYASASYSIQPYAYWSVNGALVLNYAVELPTTGAITPFWETNYSQKPDLTFNSYYRNFAQKGLGGLAANMADWTKEITISPETPKEGDTVAVTAEIHNYSLCATAVPVKVHFYLGSSEDGGIPVSDLNGDTVFTTSSPVQARGDQILQFLWRVPTGLYSSDSILYAVIDPDNNIGELNKDNNKGWNRVQIIGEMVTGVKAAHTVTSFKLLQNYPNPFNPTTQISYTLGKASNVTLKVYDILGREIATLVSGKNQPGEHSVNWNAVNVSSGVYFYRIVAGNFVQTKKMLLMK